MDNGNSRNVPAQGQEFQALVENWAASYNNPDYDPLPFLTRIARMLEEEMGRFLTTDPDPYDERCLVKAEKCCLRFMHSVLYRNSEFFNRLLHQYILSGNEEVAIMCCRIMISFNSAVTINIGVSDNNALMDRLYEWALEKEDKDLSFFATYIIGVIMEMAEQVTIHKDKNFQLITVSLNRLHRLSKQMVEVNRTHVCAPGINAGGDECSNSSWNGDPELSNVGQYMFDVLTVELKQRLTLKFLVPMAEYQDMLPQMLEGDAVALVFIYLDSCVTTDVRLVFEGLRFLTSLLCHKRISSQFIQSNGIQSMLTIPRPSVASTAISVNLYYMAYFEEAMELVCRLPMAVLEKIVDYALWLLECSHESGRCYILMFFAHAFSYKIILNLFDRRDGFRRLINVLSTQPVLREPNENEDPPHGLVVGEDANGAPAPAVNAVGNGIAAIAGALGVVGAVGAAAGGAVERNGSTDSRSLSDDTMYTSRQVIKLVSTVVCKYMEVHAILRGEQLAQEHPWAYGSQSPPVNNDAAHWKPIRYSTEQLHETLDVIFSLSPTSMTWPPVDSFERLDCLSLFLRVLVLAAFEWRQYAGRTETVRNIIDTLAVCVAVPRVMEHFTHCEVYAGGHKYEGVELMLLMTDNDKFLEPAAQRAALFLLSACVCRPLEGKKDAYLETNLRPPSHLVDRKRKYASPGPVYPPTIDVYLSNLWNTVRRHNGIMVLLRLLETRTPISDADSIRELACKALLGLSRDKAVNQMLARLPLFGKGQLQYMMKEPVLPDKRAEHNRFCRYAVHLMQRVCGHPLSNLPADLFSMEKLRRAEIVASTRIHWDEKELLALVHKHLLHKGLSRTAETLQKEADLGHLVQPQPPSPPAIYPTDAEPAEKEAPSTPTPMPALPPPTATPSSTIRFSLSTPNTPTAGVSSLSVVSTPVAAAPIVANSSTPASSLSQHNLLHASVFHERPSSSAPHPNVFLQPTRPATVATVHNSEQTLEKIIEGYLNQQHALCPHPVTTCPSFSLLRPHRCPEPRTKSHVSANMTKRLVQRQLNPLMSNMDYMKEHRRFIFSRFKPHYVLRDTDGEHCTACCFSTQNDNLLYVGVGQVDGPNDVKVINLATEEMFSWTSVVNCSFNHMCLSPDSQLLIGCTMWTSPTICVWGLPSEMSEQSHLTPKIRIEEEGYAEFSKTSSSSIVVTKEMSAVVMDVATAEPVVTLYDAQKCNNYQRNRATFSYCDQLVLNDGVLWDLRTSKAVHKFDKLQNEFSGVFHPNRLEVLIGSAVWDMRTFGLSKNISALEGLETRFNSTGHVMYAGAFYWKDEYNNIDVDQSMRGIFRTLDALDYGLIATIDLKRRLHCLALDSSDRYLALIETTPADNVCRVYQVGRTKAPDEDDDADTDDGQEGGDEGQDDVSLDDEDMADLMELVDGNVDDDDDDDDDDDNDVDLDDMAAMFNEFAADNNFSDSSSDSSDSSSPDSGNESSTEEEDDEGYEESNDEA